MSTKMEALEKNKTWDIVELPKGKNLVGCKWVFAMKNIRQMSQSKDTKQALLLRDMPRLLEWIIQRPLHLQPR